MNHNLLTLTTQISYHCQPPLKSPTTVNPHSKFLPLSTPTQIHYHCHTPLTGYSQGTTSGELTLATANGGPIGASGTVTMGSGATVQVRGKRGWLGGWLLVVGCWLVVVSWLFIV